MRKRRSRTPVTQKFRVISSGFGVFCYETLDSAFRILHSAMRVTVEPFLSTLLIVTLASFCAFSPVLCRGGSGLRMAPPPPENSRFSDFERGGPDKIKESGASLERSLYKKLERKIGGSSHVPFERIRPDCHRGKRWKWVSARGLRFF